MVALLAKVNMQKQESSNGAGDTCSPTNASSRPFLSNLSGKPAHVDAVMAPQKTTAKEARSL